MQFPEQALSNEKAFGNHSAEQGFLSGKPFFMKLSQESWHVVHEVGNHLVCEFPVVIATAIQWMVRLEWR